MGSGSGRIRGVYWAGVIVVAAVVSLFAASNREVVPLGFWPLPFLAEAPLYLVVLVALLFGILIGALAVWIRGGRRRRELRECSRQNAALARELAATQAQLAREAPTRSEALNSTG
ncbi:MAG TPA: lipopolysaccharide assembly protein LapA domain-containing protein [Stellaceae bacterium]|nr:lipopolysaccharide assembly protein LapA domain-containing protein [Stellaceae bacterium]